MKLTSIIFTIMILLSIGTKVHARSKISCDPKNPCWICTPSLREKGRLWCKEHDRYEDRCWLCHPEMHDKSRLYCGEHGVYEDECTLCHPEVTKKLSKFGIEGKLQKEDEEGGCQACTTSGKAGGQVQQNTSRLFCREHDVFEDECAICQPGLASDLAVGSGLKIRFPSEKSIEKAGVKTATLEKVSGKTSLEAFAETSYNNNHLVQITPLTKGVVLQVLVTLGDRVSKGDPLLVLSSVEVSEAKLKYLQATLNKNLLKEELERQSHLSKDGISSQKTLRESKRAYEFSKLELSTTYQHLINLGFTESEVEQVSQKGNTDPTITLRAPSHGTVIGRKAVKGQSVERGDELLKVANLDSMWIEISMNAKDLYYIRKGQELYTTFPDLPTMTFKGIISWIDTQVDPRSQMLRARAEVQNHDHRLIAGLFGNSQISLSETLQGLGVPKHSIHQISEKPYVFIKEEDDLYTAIRVEVGPTVGDLVMIKAGLSSDDQVVISGSHIVYSEMFKGKLGAGCVDD